MATKRVRRQPDIGVSLFICSPATWSSFPYLPCMTQACHWTHIYWEHPVLLWIINLRELAPFTSVCIYLFIKQQPSDCCLIDHLSARAFLYQPAFDVSVLKILLMKLPARAIENGNKICKLKIHERKLHNMSNSVDGTVVKILDSKYLVIIWQNTAGVTFSGTSCIFVSVIYLYKNMEKSFSALVTLIVGLWRSHLLLSMTSSVWMCLTSIQRFVRVENMTCWNCYTDFVLLWCILLYCLCVYLCNCMSMGCWLITADHCKVLMFCARLCWNRK